MVCCGHRVGVLLVVGVGGRYATHVVCCAESQITGSPPLVSDLDILCEMEHDGPVVFLTYSAKSPPERGSNFELVILRNLSDPHRHLLCPSSPKSKARSRQQVEGRRASKRALRVCALE